MRLILLEESKNQLTFAFIHFIFFLITLYYKVPIFLFFLYFSIDHYILSRDLKQMSSDHFCYSYDEIYRTIARARNS
jgi:hypothetical protein